MTSVKLINHSSSTADWNNYITNGKHGKIDPVGTDEIDPVKTA